MGAVCEAAGRVLLAGFWHLCQVSGSLQPILKAAGLLLTLFSKSAASLPLGNLDIHHIFLIVLSSSYLPKKDLDLPKYDCWGDWGKIANVFNYLQILAANVYLIFGAFIYIYIYLSNIYINIYILETTFLLQNNLRKWKKMQSSFEYTQVVCFSVSKFLSLEPFLLPSLFTLSPPLPRYPPPCCKPCLPDGNQLGKPLISH